MKQIQVHHTDWGDGPWDGPANEARLRTDGDAEYYRSAFAWQDAEGDPDAISSYRFLHHMIADDGEVLEANTRAAIAGIAVLNGGRVIPVDDRQSVYDHLATHLKDADMEPPDLRQGPLPEREQRAFAVKELRVARDNGSAKIVGYAAVFDVLSEELWGFREKIAPGAFSKTIREADVRALWNHDSNYVLGRTKSGTLSLMEDEIGLAIEVEPPDAQWARDLMVSIDRSDVDQMSFGFYTIRDKWEMDDDEELIRTLQEVELFDVSPVTYPAYPQTTVQLRSILEKQLDELDTANFSEAERTALLRITDRIRDKLTTAPAEGSHPVEGVEDDAVGEVAIAHRKRKHELQLLD